MSDSKLIQFIITPQGNKKYDYTALGNIPQMCHYEFYSDGNLPLPSEKYHGNIAFVQSSYGKEKILPHICLKRKGKFVWAPFALKAEDRAQVGKPYIQLYKDKLDTPEIILDIKKVATPEIYIDIDITPAILGEAILGYCYLGEKQESTE